MRVSHLAEGRESLAFATGAGGSSAPLLQPVGGKPRGEGALSAQETRARARARSEPRSPAGLGRTPWGGWRCQAVPRPPSRGSGAGGGGPAPSAINSALPPAGEARGAREDSGGAALKGQRRRRPPLPGSPRGRAEPSPSRRPQPRPGGGPPAARPRAARPGSVPRAQRRGELTLS